MSRIYVGNLPIDIKESEIDDLFYKYGRIREIDVKTPARPPAFCFITFDDIRDAEDAVRGRDGYYFDGGRLRCEFAKGDRRGGRDDDRRDVVFTDVDRNGDGVVDFGNRSDMERAIRTLDDTEFKNYNESSFIRVKPANKRERSEEGRGRDKRSVSRSVSRSRSPIRKRSPRSRSRSHSRRPSPKPAAVVAASEPAAEAVPAESVAEVAAESA
jgi:arginine/serine-rich splicing factor 1/9